mmetsp:Transcript_8137/g.9004  ORF Transcript_8137/g.9004 Transcript_8137/m.9004 type:complete len:84 (-) Transcript_8137:177-428(-)|eukprot:CAMPEP_0194132820 /NCGR_PEP_ID=MMETSP0152-20130528/3198_1 /TAXON_ID=1049557 /ORGANISM="Thalassiothrix antarctica, Strain L6-D1" /LENGTH=83 /DNA_ID=CAMNT_0038827995 /DNA_START=95 /DNA_END=346 /DNA_ORIENTATION=+
MKESDVELESNNACQLKERPSSKRRVRFAKKGTRRTIPSLDPRIKKDLFYSPMDIMEFREVYAEDEKAMEIVFHILLGTSSLW